MRRFKAPSWQYPAPSFRLGQPLDDVYYVGFVVEISQVAVGKHAGVSKAYRPAAVLFEPGGHVKGAELLVDILPPVHVEVRKAGGAAPCQGVLVPR